MKTPSAKTTSDRVPTSSLGQFRRIERVQPGWLIWSGLHPEVPWEWREVKMVMQGGPVVAIVFMDENRIGGQVGDEVQVITCAQKRQRREALGS
jgi:hypothetical protein